MGKEKENVEFILTKEINGDERVEGRNVEVLRVEEFVSGKEDCM